MGIQTITPVAVSVPFDNATNGFVSTDVQAAIEEIGVTAAVSASPGFTWGYKGVATAGTYAENDGVPSNVSGRIVPLNAGYISDIFVLNEYNTTYSIDVQRRVGAVFTTLYTGTVVAARGNVFSVNIAVAKLDELCVRVSPSTANNPKNIDIGIIIKGTI